MRPVVAMAGLHEVGAVTRNKRNKRISGTVTIKWILTFLCHICPPLSQTIKPCPVLDILHSVDGIDRNLTIKASMGI